jgi:hypothetical protein
MLEWIKIRDEETCEVYHKLYDHNVSDTVVTIRQDKRQFRVQILDRVPFHTKKLNTAKSASQHIYEQTCT